MKRFALLFLPLVFLVLGCTDRDDELNAVNIRVRNVSSINFDEVQVGDSEEVHVHIAQDAFSGYLPYETAYKIAYIQVISGSDTYVIQPADYVGEEPLPRGFYTYELDVSEAGDLSLNFVID